MTRGDGPPLAGHVPLLITRHGNWIALVQTTAIGAETIRREDHPTDKGERVRFRISDVFLPSPEDLLMAPEKETEGAIVDFSDSGAKPRAFAVVEVDDGQTIVIPVEKLTLVRSAPPESGR